MGKETEKFKYDIFTLFEQIMGEQEIISHAASWMADEISKDHVIHAIGTGGHSNLMVEETLWRAGGLAPMNAMLDCGTNLMMGAKRSNIVERTPGYGKTVFDMYGCKKDEVIIICNAYGINSMTIDVALEAKARGLRSIGITSTGFCDVIPQGHRTRHPSGLNLYEIVDIFIDDHVPYPDSICEIDGLDQLVAGTSVLCNSFVWNLLLIETCRILMKKGIKPPVWMSGNAVNGDETNYEMEQKYYPRIKHLR
ncbi:MAG: sugar isomerase domain-containing protein [Flexilinea sp.]